MKKRNFDLDYYRNADSGIHVQCIENSVEAGKPHTHNYFQIYYISKGRLCHVTEGGSLQLSRGDMFIIPPGKEHHIENVEDALFYTFSFTEDILHPNGGVSPAMHFLKSLGNEVVKARVPVHDDELLLVEGIMEKMNREFIEKRPGYEDMLRSYAVILLTVFARNYYLDTDSFPMASDNRSMILYSIEYIKDNYMSDLSLEEMCQRSAMSRSSFCKLFSAMTGMSFKTYLHTCRVQAAIGYIKRGYNISVIYGLVGYNDFTTFYRNFKKIMGCSPMSYKQHHKLCIKQ